MKKIKYIKNEQLTYRDLLEFISNLPEDKLDDPVVILDTYYEQFMCGIRANVNKVYKLPYIEV